MINIASTGAYQPVPLMAVYGATKAEFFDVAGENAQVGSFQAPTQVVGIALGA